jgi:predicted nucleic acid-binding protein
LDVPFLDANILFSAAYREGSGLVLLWQLADVRLITSEYAYLEARHNLAEEDKDAEGKLARLKQLMRSVTICDAASPELLDKWDTSFRDLIDLPEKDRPIFVAAVAARATHLLTGDRAHFGPHLGRTVEGVLILLPGEYLRGHRPQQP